MHTKRERASDAEVTEHRLADTEMNISDTSVQKKNHIQLLQNSVVSDGLRLKMGRRSVLIGSRIA